MPTIRYMRNMDGAEKMFQDGCCWADSVLWSIDNQPQIMTFEDVGSQRQCGYCSRCLEEGE